MGEQALHSETLGSKPPAADESAGKLSHSSAPPRRASSKAEPEAVILADKVLTINTDSSDDEVVVLGLAEPTVPAEADAVHAGEADSRGASAHDGEAASDNPLGTSLPIGTFSGNVVSMSAN